MACPNLHWGPDQNVDDNKMQGLRNCAMNCLCQTCLILLIDIRFQPSHGMLTLNPKLNHVMSAILRLCVVIFAYTNPSKTLWILFYV
jgi:hypothetical protein